MRLEGYVMKPSGKKNKAWHVEVPALGVSTQGKTKADAYRMIKDAIEVSVDKPGFEVEVIPREGYAFEVSATDIRTFLAFLLRQQRTTNGLTLQEMAGRLGINSPNAYARYEQGKTAPTVEKLIELLHAIDPKKGATLRIGK